MAKITSNTIREIFGAVVKITGKSLINKITQKVGNNQKELTTTQLFDIWEENNTPNDSDEIIRMLQNTGVSNTNIKRAFETVGLEPSEAEDPDITKFSNAIKKAGLAEPTLQYLNSLNESTVLTEKPMSNKDIRNVFIQIIDNVAAGNREDEMESILPNLGRKRAL